MRRRLKLEMPGYLETVLSLSLAIPISGTIIEVFRPSLSFPTRLGEGDVTFVDVRRLDEYAEGHKKSASWRR
jgi:hypothetical protein